jgi:hypothetical protein
VVLIFYQRKLGVLCALARGTMSRKATKIAKKTAMKQKGKIIKDFFTTDI